jgi:hypothetical protein
MIKYLMLRLTDSNAGLNSVNLINHQINKFHPMIPRSNVVTLYILCNFRISGILHV